MIKSFVRTIIEYIAAMIIAGLIFCIDAQAAEIVIGVAPGQAVVTDIPGNAAEKVESAAKTQQITRPQNDQLDKYMHPDLQEYIWQLCISRGLEGKELKQYYACMIGLAEGESTFNAKKKNQHNRNGSCDKGLYQVNEINVPRLKKLGYISCSDDLYNAYNAARCGEYLFWEGYEHTGYDEQCYTRYLYGDKKWRSNEYTQRVWKLMQNWYQELWG